VEAGRRQAEGGSGGLTGVPSSSRNCGATTRHVAPPNGNGGRRSACPTRSVIVGQPRVCGIGDRMDDGFFRKRHRSQAGSLRYKQKRQRRARVARGSISFVYSVSFVVPSNAATGGQRSRITTSAGSNQMGAGMDVSRARWRGFSSRTFSGAWPSVPTSTKCCAISPR
jgi:hypothetical protein